jgi:hypothetical protein
MHLIVAMVNSGVLKSVGEPRKANANHPEVSGFRRLFSCRLRR